MPELIVYSGDAPVSKEAGRDRKRRQAAGEEVGGVAHYAVATPRTGEWLVLASQACDIVKPEASEPRVDALRAFQTTNETILRMADRNSVRYFLLDPARRLVADASFRVQIEKPVLRLYQPESGLEPGNEERRRRFIRWLARRYDRPALPDAVVKAIGEPIRGLLTALVDGGATPAVALDYVDEVRISGDWKRRPIRFNLLFLVDEAAEDAAPIDLAPIVGSLEEKLDQSSAVLNAWAARSRRGISLADVEATEPLFLEDLSRGGGRGIVGG